MSGSGDEEKREAEGETGAAPEGDGDQSLRERAASGSWMGVLDEAIKTRMVDEDGRPQDMTEAEAAVGFTLTVIPNYGKGHLGLTPAQASAVAIALPGGGHLVKEFHLGDRVYYAEWSGRGSRPAWTTDHLEQAVRRFGLPLMADDHSES